MFCKLYQALIQTDSLANVLFENLGRLPRRLNFCVAVPQGDARWGRTMPMLAKAEHLLLPTFEGLFDFVGL